MSNAKTLPLAFVLALIIAIGGGVYNYANTEAQVETLKEKQKSTSDTLVKLKSSDSTLLVAAQTSKFTDSIQTLLIKRVLEKQEETDDDINEIKDVVKDINRKLE